MKKILIPIDGSEHSTKGLIKAKDICSLSNCDVWIITVVNTLKDCNYIVNQEFKAQVCKENIKRGEKILKEATDIFAEYPGKVVTKLCKGDVSEEIISLAESGGFDLVIMGNRGVGAFSRTLLGSVSNKVVNNIKVSVLIVK